MNVKYRTIKTATLLATIAPLFMVAQNVSAQGFIERVGGPHEYQIELSGSDVQNTVGYAVRKDFALAGRYSGVVDCPIQINNGEVFYKAISNMVPSAMNPGYFMLNDFMDVKVEIWIAGGLGKFVPVPFDNVSNKKDGEICRPPSRTITDFASGGEGKVTFKVTKKIVNGVSINNSELVQMFGRQGNLSPAFSNIPMVKVNIASAMLFVPDKCVINEGQQINVDFGENNGVDINNKNIMRAIPVEFKCDGGAFETGKLNIKLGLSGDASSFDSNLFKTNKEALGVKFTHNGESLTPNTFYPVENIDNRGRWDLNAALVSKNNQNIDEGEFEASATVVASFL